MDQGQSPVSWVQHGKDVGHGREHRQASPPARFPVLDAELQSRPDYGGGPVIGAQHLQQTQDGLGHDQGEALFEALLQAAQVVAGPIGLGANDDEHIGTVDLDRVGSYVIGEGVQSAPRCEVEAGVVPMTGEKSVLDAPSVQWKAHVRATVVHRIGTILGPEHTNRLGPDLAGQAPCGLKLVHRADPGSGHARPFPGRPCSMLTIGVKPPLRSSEMGMRSGPSIGANGRPERGSVHPSSSMSRC